MFEGCPLLDFLFFDCEARIARPFEIVFLPSRDGKLQSHLFFPDEALMTVRNEECHRFDELM